MLPELVGKWYSKASIHHDSTTTATTAKQIEVVLSTGSRSTENAFAGKRNENE